MHSSPIRDRHLHGRNENEALVHPLSPRDNPFCGHGFFGETNFDYSVQCLPPLPTNKSRRIEDEKDQM